jgi:hypothetical protein
LLFLKLGCIGRPKLLASFSYRFIGEGDATFGEEFFHLSKAQEEPMVEPNGVTNDCRGKTVTLVAEDWLY